MDVIYFKAHCGLQLELMKSFSHAMYPSVQKRSVCPAVHFKGLQRLWELFCSLVVAGCRQFTLSSEIVLDVKTTCCLLP